ncbi:MAG: hypothetical protein WBM67_06175 [Sedimenticolaceae bacterium]
MSKKTIFATALVLLFSALPMAATAADFDGSRALTCAAIFSTECTAEDQRCRSGAPWVINFPVFIEMDFKAKELSTNAAHKTPRVSKISHVGRLEGGHTAVQGIDGEYVWSMMIAEDTGSFTMSISGEETGFVIFGACHGN